MKKILILLFMINIIILLSPIISSAEYVHPFVAKLIDWSYPKDGEVTVPLAYCNRMGYNIKIDSVINIPMCVFDDGNYCTTDDFYLSNKYIGFKSPTKYCGQNKVKALRDRREGEYVFAEFEKCEKGLVPSKPKYLLEQPHCEYPSLFKKIWGNFKSLFRTIDISNVPFCDDINVTGTDCHYIGDIFDKGTYNYSSGICKQYETNPAIEHPKIGICFSTLDNDFEELKNIFRQCLNCTLQLNKTKCTFAGECSSDMSLEGCSYDGCNYCCNNECTVMACEKEPINISKLNFTFGYSRPANEQIPKNYVQITIYETNCQCLDGMGWYSHCKDYYCYNQSNIIWVPKE